jgi:acetyl-CoA acetyltransferase
MTTAAITGLGYARIARDSERSGLDLAAEASRNAIADAGLHRDDIDGLVTFPDRTSPPTSFQGPSIESVQRALGLRNLTYWQSFGTGPGQFGAVLGAVHAVGAGAARHVLAMRAHKRQDRAYLPLRPDGSGLAWDEDAYTMPYGAAGGAARLAPWATRHMHEYGTTQEHLGSVVLTCRDYAVRNPRAYWREPLTMQQYLDSPWVSTPFKRLDCDYPVEGAVALVISAGPNAADLAHKPAYVAGGAQAAGPGLNWSQWPDMTRMASWYVAEQLWSRTYLRPADVDVAELYDGFSWLAICWLEDMRFVAKGEGGPFFAEGRGRLDGDLPVCTDGGQLGMGRLHGFGKIAQAVLQLRGEAGANQKPGATVAVACAGGGPQCAALLLTGEQT